MPDLIYLYLCKIIHTFSYSSIFAASTSEMVCNHLYLPRLRSKSEYLIKISYISGNYIGMGYIYLSYHLFAASTSLILIFPPIAG